MIQFAPIIVSVFLVSGVASAEEAKMPRAELWNQVAAAEDQGLPQTAIKYIGPIIQSALADKAWARLGDAVSVRRRSPRSRRARAM